MLGRYPLPYLDQTACKGELHSTQSHEIVLLPSSEDAKPVLLPPHQIVIGFDVTSDNSKSFQVQASESPRSVLEPDNLCFRMHQRQSQSPRSPLSVLGSLLSGQPRKGSCMEGAALCLKGGADAEEACNEAITQRVPGFVAREVGAVAHHNYSKAEERACDVHCKAVNLDSKPVAFSGVGYVAVGKTQPWNHGHLEQAFSGCGTSPLYKTFLSSPCEDGGREDGDDGGDSSKIDVSLFSTASPVSDYFSHSRPAVDFLSRCFLCRRHLAQGKDIYMYRGDRAFCSQECRHRQIVIDERKESCPASAACVYRTSIHNQAVRRAAQAAIAT